MNEISESIIEYDYLDLFLEISPDVEELLRARLNSAKNYSEVYSLLGEVKGVLEKLLPVATPLAIIESVERALRHAESRGLSLEEAGDLALQVIAQTGTYMNTAISNIAQVLTREIKQDASILSLGYSRFLRDVLASQKGRVSSVHTTFGRPVLSGRRMAVELLARGIKSYSWPDVHQASVMKRVDYVVMSTPGVGVDGVLALDPECYSAIALAKLMNKPVYLVLTGLAVVDADVDRNADKRIEVDLVDRQVEVTLSLAPFSYASIADVDLIITEFGEIAKGTRKDLEELAAKSREALVGQALRALGG
ncbi:IF-2B domain-containing protein [Stetteria hydrogenophila]